MNQRQITQLCTLERIAAVENLFHASSKARRTKSRRPDVEDWWRHRESAILRLREALLSGGHVPGSYRFFEIFEPKRRVIAAAPFENRVVHHALCLQLWPVLGRTFIARSYSCQIGKGTTAARECCRQLTNKHRFVLKCDVRNFFLSIDHEVLVANLAERVSDPGALELILRILESYRTEPGPGRARGLPIGNLTSQLWGNFYLDELDHWITEIDQHGPYLRYMDDFLLFGDD